MIKQQSYLMHFENIRVDTKQTPVLQQGVHQGVGITGRLHKQNPTDDSCTAITLYIPSSTLSKKISSRISEYGKYSFFFSAFFLRQVIV